MSFDSAFQRTIGFERALSKDPHDPGNWTGGKIGVGLLKGTNRYGISAAQYPEEDIEGMTEFRAKTIYASDYWIPMGLSTIPSKVIHEEIFDTGVNCGPKTAILIAQRALNFLGETLEEDGIMGQATIGRINAWVTRDEEALFRALNGFQFVRYLSIVTAKNDHRYARGWMRRVQDYRQDKEESFDDLISCHA